MCVAIREKKASRDTLQAQEACSLVVEIERICTIPFGCLDVIQCCIQGVSKGLGGNAKKRYI